MSGIYQHRRVDILPGENAGTFKMFLVDSDPIAAYCGRYAETAERYIAAYEATGLRQSLGSCYGHIGMSLGSSLCSMERMGVREMAAYRRWVVWRRRMSPAAAAVVDDVLLHGFRPQSIRLLYAGLRALSR